MNMKKMMFALLVFSLITFSANAQQVYNEVFRLSKKIADSTQLDIETRKIATFKVDALEYMAMKAAEVMPDSSMSMLDHQAYALYDFINSFTRRLALAPKGQKDAIIAVYRNASINNSWFNDEDKELVWSYYNNPNYITQFSLDTNWEKAVEVVNNRKW
jgi:type II secretory pathway component PulJ